MELAGVSGANGTMIRVRQITSCGSLQAAVGSSAKSHSPFSDCQFGRHSCGLG
jgi:hypothetical protein